MLKYCSCENISGSKGKGNNAQVLNKNDKILTLWGSHALMTNRDKDDREKMKRCQNNDKKILLSHHKNEFNICCYLYSNTKFMLVIETCVYLLKILVILNSHVLSFTVKEVVKPIVSD